MAVRLFALFRARLLIVQRMIVCIEPEHDAAFIGRIVVCPSESLLVCARARRDLCETWKRTGRVDQLATAALSFGEVKTLLGLDRFLHLRDTVANPE